MYARSRGVTRVFAALAFCTSSKAFGSSSGAIAALIFGPSTRAWPQYAIAHEGSSRAASANARPASGWLKPYARFKPWLMNCCARTDFVVTLKVWLRDSAIEAQGRPPGLGPRHRPADNARGRGPARPRTHR